MTRVPPAPAPARKTLLSSLFPSTSTRKSSEADTEQKKSSKPSDSTKPASTSASSADRVRRPLLPLSTLDHAPAANKPDGVQIAADRRIGEELTRQLQEAKGNGQLKGFGMSVHVENGYVWLKGRVGSAAQQQMVLDLARRTEGVRQVINELTVGESASSIAQNLNQVLQTAETEGTLRGANLNVKVDGPDVWLTGTVSKPEQEQLAVDLARKVPGVRRVISGLELNRVSQASLASPAPIASLLPPVAISASQLGTPQAEPATAVSGMQPTAAVRFTKQAEAPPGGNSGGAGGSSCHAERGGSARRGTVRTDEQQRGAGPVAMMPAPVAPNPPPAVGGYVYYNQYPTTQASMPMVAMDQTPRPLGLPQMASYAGAMAAAPVVAISQATGMMPAQLPGPGYAAVPARYDQPSLPGYAWPTYAAHPNYAAVTYPKQYSPSAWPYIGPFYPYPQVPLGWRKVTLKWDDGWWNLDFKAK